MRSWWIRYGLAAAAALVLAGCGRPGERELRSARRALERGLHARARAYLERALTRPLPRGETARAQNLLGIACWHLGEVEQAAAAFKESQRLNPDLVDPIYNLGVLLYRQGDPLRASALFEEAALVAPSDPSPLEFLGAIYTAQGQWKQAQRTLEDAATRAPESARVLTALAVAELRADGPPAAVLRLMRALEKDARYAPALYDLFVIHDRWLGDARQARPFGERFLDVAGRDARADAVRARLAAMASNGTPGEDTGGQTAVVPPTPPPTPPAPATPGALLAEARERARRGAPEAALGLCLRAAELAASAGDEAARERAFEEAVRLAPGLAGASLALGTYRAGQERWTDALAAFKDASRLAPDSAEVHRKLAEAAARTGERDTALIALRRVTRLTPDDPEGWWSLAQLYDRTLRLPAEAAEVYRTFARRFPLDTRSADARDRLAELAPGTPDGNGSGSAVSPGGREVTWTGEPQRDRRAAIEAFNRGTVYQQDGDMDRAIYYYKRALELDDRFVTALFNLATVYRARGEDDLARDAYDKVLKLNPESTAARYNLAILHHAAGRRTAAVDQLRQVLRGEPGYAAAHYLLGLVYAEEQDTQALARTHFQRFVELAPSDPLAPSVQRWLRENR